MIFFVTFNQFYDKVAYFECRICYAEVIPHQLEDCLVIHMYKLNGWSIMRILIAIITVELFDTYGCLNNLQLDRLFAKMIFK